MTIPDFYRALGGLLARGWEARPCGGRLRLHKDHLDSYAHCPVSAVATAFTGQRCSVLRPHSAGELLGLTQEDVERLLGAADTPNGEWSAERVELINDL